jgi:periplasmic protein TonB
MSSGRPTAKPPSKSTAPKPAQARVSTATAAAAATSSAAASPASRPPLRRAIRVVRDPSFGLSKASNMFEQFVREVGLQIALVASLTIHAFFIVGVGFKLIDQQQFAAPHNMLDVVLVNSKSMFAPDKADALAQSNLDGGGNTDQKLRASSPLPNVNTQSVDTDLSTAQTKLARLEQEAQQLQTQLKSKSKVPVAEVAEQQNAPTDPERSQELVEKQIEIARLEAQIKEQYQQYQERPKRQFIGARTKEYRFAQYVDVWREKIERIGNLNYPEEAKNKRIYGTLQLTVAIKANGEVESIEINKSSGRKVLDDAARRIVALSAPFEPFPSNIRRDTDILHITRTWTFSREDALSTE